jgi:hypothetical protein
MFCSSDLWNLCGFSIEEDLLCEAQSCNTDFVLQSKVFFTFQLTVHINFLKEDYYV